MRRDRKMVVGQNAKEKFLRGPGVPRDCAPRLPRDCAPRVSRDYAPRVPRDCAPNQSCKCILYRTHH